VKEMLVKPDSLSY